MVTLLRQAQVSSVHLMSAAFVVDVSQLEVYWRTMVTLLRQAQVSSVHLMSAVVVVAVGQSWCIGELW